MEALKSSLAALKKPPAPVVEMPSPASESKPRKVSKAGG